MVWVILSILLMLVIAGAFVAAFVTRSGTAVAVLVGAIATWVALTIGLSLATIGTGQVGLQYNFAGKLSDNLKDSPGTIWKAPWTHIRKESVQIQREELVLDNSNAAVTKDQQEITANLVLNYQVDPKRILDLYRRVGPNWKTKLIDSRVLQDFKEVTSTYPTVLITQKREDLRKDTRIKLQGELKRYSIDVTDFFIQNIGFSQAYQDAITAKQVQVQQAQQAEAKVAQANAEADQAIATARGEKGATIARAQGDAESIRLRGNALRNHPEVIRYEAIQKLATQAQVIFCTTNNCPSILGGLGK